MSKTSQIYEIFDERSPVASKSHREPAIRAADRMANSKGKPVTVYRGNKMVGRAWPSSSGSN